MGVAALFRSLRLKREKRVPEWTDQEAFGACMRVVIERLDELTRKVFSIRNDFDAYKTESEKKVEELTRQLADMQDTELRLFEASIKANLLSWGLEASAGSWKRVDDFVASALVGHPCRRSIEFLRDLVANAGREVGIVGGYELSVLEAGGDIVVKKSRYPAERRK